MAEPTASSPDLLNACVALLQESDRKASERTKAGIEGAAAALDQAIARLKPATGTLGQPALHLLGVVYTRKANLVRDYGSAAGLGLALSLYEEARKAMEGLPLDSHPSVRDDLGGVWANRGIALMGIPDPRAVADAVGCFDKSIALREPLVASKEPWFLYNLLGVLINRGDALVRLPGADSRASALASYDRALELGSQLPTTGQPIFRRRLIVAQLNRGRILLEDASPERWKEALAAFDSVIEARGLPQGEAPADIEILAAGALTNKAATYLRMGLPEPARACASESLEIAKKSEETDLAGLEAGLNARHALCSALGAEIADANVSPALREDYVSRTTDCAEGGLALEKLWEERGIDRLRPLAAELFRIAMRIYEAYQPQFLAEFILENLEEPKGFAQGQARGRLLSDAVAALSRAIEKLRAQGFPPMGSPKMERYVSTLHDLRDAQERLAALRAEAAKAPSVA